MRVFIEILFCLTVCLLLLGTNQVSGATEWTKDSSKHYIHTRIGIVVDDIYNTPIPFASVALHIQNDSSIASTVSDEFGIFKFKDVSLCCYIIKVQHVSYTPQQLETTFSQKDTLRIRLNQAAKSLHELTIVSAKTLIEDQADRIVYNADQDINNSGGDATMVLQKAPMITVDPNGLPSIKSSKNVKILLNGRPIHSSNLIVTLKQIPSDLVSRIEVIASPSAKYESEGVGGIINIITKKKLAKGLSSYITMGAGTKGSHLIGTISKQNRRVGISTNLSSNWYYNRIDGYSHLDKTSALSPPTAIIEQTFGGNVNGNFSTIQSSITIEKDERNVINVDISGTLQRNNSRIPVQASFLIEESSDKRLAFIRSVQNVESNSFLRINTDYTHKFKKSEKELSALLSYSNNSLLTMYKFDQSQVNSSTVSSANRSPNAFEELAYQLDFQNTMQKKKNSLKQAYERLFAK